MMCYCQRSLGAMGRNIGIGMAHFAQRGPRLAQLTIMRMRSAGASSPRWDCAGRQAGRKAGTISTDGTTATTGIDDDDRDKHALLEKSFSYYC
jgi:hypothetical protein